MASYCPLESMRPMKLTSVIEIPIETSINPGRAIPGSWPRLLRKQFIASRNLFRPSTRSCSSCTQEPRCTSFMESRIASTGAQLLTPGGTKVENPNPTGYQPSLSFCVRAVWLSCGLRICCGIRETDLVGSGIGDVEWCRAAAMRTHQLPRYLYIKCSEFCHLTLTLSFLASKIFHDLDAYFLSVFIVCTQQAAGVHTDKLDLRCRHS